MTIFAFLKSRSLKCGEQIQKGARVSAQRQVGGFFSGLGESG